MRTMTKIAIINLKGGVGKSVTACNLACVLGWKYSRRVLVMDLDKQANSSKFFKCFDPDEKSMADVLTLEAKLGDVIRIPDYTKLGNVIQIPDYTNFQFVDVAPSCMNMIFANQRLTLETMRPRHDRLRNALEKHREDYDYCIMDCPPDIDMATVNALVCADWVIIPVDCGEWAMDGLAEILKQVKEAKEAYNPALEVLCVLPTMYRRTRYGAQTINELAYSKLPLFRYEDGRILRIDASVKVQEAISEHMPLYAYSPKSKASEQYIELARHVVKKVEG